MINNCKLVKVLNISRLVGRSYICYSSMSLQGRGCVCHLKGNPEWCLSWFQTYKSFSKEIFPHQQAPNSTRENIFLSYFYSFIHSLKYCFSAYAVVTLLEFKVS